MIESHIGEAFGILGILSLAATSMFHEFVYRFGYTICKDEIKAIRVVSAVTFALIMIIIIPCHIHNQSLKFVTDNFTIYDKDGAKYVKFNDEELNLNDKFRKNYNQDTIKLKYHKYSESFYGFIYNWPLPREVKDE